MTKEYSLVLGHVRSIETIINSIPERNHLSNSNRSELKKILASFEYQLSEFKSWNEKQKG